jgi:hypothetical protein
MYGPSSVAFLAIIVSYSDTSNHQQLFRAVLFSRNPIRFFHEHETKALMLKARRVSRRNGHGRAVHVQLANDTRTILGDFLQPRRVGYSAQPEKTNQYILQGIFVTQKGLTSAVSDIIASNQFDMVRCHRVMNLLHAYFSCPDVETGQILLMHLLPGQFAQITLLDTGLQNPTQ